MLEGWQKLQLASLIQIKHGFAFSSEYFVDSGPYVLLTPGNFVEEGGFRWMGQKQKFFNGPVDPNYVLDEGDLLIAMTEQAPGLLGSSFFVPEADRYLHNQRLGKAVVARRDLLDKEYLHHWLNRSRVRQEIFSEASGTKVKHTSPDKIRSLEIDLPPLPEQRRITEILRTWDKAIEKLDAMRAAKERRLHILREKLTYADVHHEPVRLGDVTDEVTTRNGTGGLDRDKVMGVTNSRGIVPMREQTIAGDISRYKIVADQSFAYNPMRINVGSIARNQTGEEILVSPDYVAFACKPDGVLPDYLDHLRNTKWWAHYINSGGSGSVRQRTYYGDLAAMKVPLPAVAEQQCIADALNTAQRDAKATALEITALQRQKRGLMQKLLTGEWRVTVGRRTGGPE